MAKMLNRGGKTNVISVTVLPPTRDRMAPKLGILRAMNSSRARVDVRKTHLFHVNSKEMLDGESSLSSHFSV